MAEERTKSGRIWLWIGAAALTICVFFVARSLLREKLPIREAQVGHKPLQNTVSTNGRVEPVSNYEVHSPLATSVKAVYVQQGDQVSAGKLLLQLDDLQARARVASAESGVRAAESALDSIQHNGTLQERQGAETDMSRARIDRDQAQHDLEALTRLKATGAASASEVAAAQQRLDSAEAVLHGAQQSSTGHYSPADVARAQAALSDAESNLALAREQLAKTAPRAPVAGTVYTLDVARTQFVEDGKLLLQIADLHHERIRAYFDEPVIGRLAVGQPVVIKWDAKPGQVWHGHITRVPITVETYANETRTVGETLVDIDDPDGQLLPDTHVNVAVTTSSEPNVLTVPREALHSENGQPFVFKVVGDSLVRTPVTIGTPNLVLAPILSGLQDGDVVATGTTNGLPLQEGVPIKVVAR
jgi:HlyD family secretion protein